LFLFSFNLPAGRQALGGSTKSNPFLYAVNFGIILMANTIGSD